MTRLLAAAALLFFAVCGCRQAEQAPGAGPQAGAGQVRYLAIGDSLTLGVGSGDKNRAFPARLADAWRAQGCAVEVENVGVGGYTAAQILADEVPQIGVFRPTLITFQSGTNDVAKGVTIDDYRENVNAVLDAARDSGARVVVLSQYDWSRTPEMVKQHLPPDIVAKRAEYDDVMIEAARAHGAQFVDLRPLFDRQADAGMWFGDGLHPTVEAYQAWADQLARDVPAPCK